MRQQTVEVVMDRPMGTFHPKHPDLYYEVNYGYVPGVMGGDGAEQDAYVLGVKEPLQRFCGTVIAVIHRRDDAEDKWVVVPEGMALSAQEIMESVRFQERFFDSYVEML